MLLIFLTSCNSKQKPIYSLEKLENNTTVFEITKTDKEWKSELNPEEFKVLREKATERPHSGKYNLHFKKGTYTCNACKAPLFTSDSKFDAHCGWPSFDKAISKGSILEKIDHSYGMVRKEILCAKCGSHLGHIFDDGPTATGLRYCVNSVSLDFKEKSDSL